MTNLPAVLPHSVGWSEKQNKQGGRIRTLGSRGRVNCGNCGNFTVLLSLVSRTRRCFFASSLPLSLPPLPPLLLVLSAPGHNHLLNFLHLLRLVLSRSRPGTVSGARKEVRKEGGGGGGKGVGVQEEEKEGGAGGGGGGVEV